MITKYRALRIDNKTTLVVQKQHFDAVFEVAKATHEVHEVEVTEELLANAYIYLTP